MAFTKRRGIDYDASTLPTGKKLRVRSTAAHRAHAAMNQTVDARVILNLVLAEVRSTVDTIFLARRAVMRKEKARVARSGFVEMEKKSTKATPAITSAHGNVNLHAIAFLIVPIQDVFEFVKTNRDRTS